MNTQPVGPSDGRTPPSAVRIAAGSIVRAACLAGATVTAGLIVFRSWATPPPELILHVSVVAGVLVGARTGWSLSRPIPDTWRRGVISAIGVFAGMMLAAAAALADMVAGRAGIAMYTAVLLLAAVRAVRLTRGTSVA